MGRSTWARRHRSPRSRSGLLGLAALFCLLRAGRGLTVLDRVVALDLFVVVLAAASIVHTAGLRAELPDVVLLVIALPAFVGSASVARFAERRRR